jgi:hypothetical protein
MQDYYLLTGANGNYADSNDGLYSGLLPLQIAKKLYQKLQPTSDPGPFTLWYQVTAGETLGVPTPYQTSDLNS